MSDLFQNDAWLFSPWAWALVTGALSLWCVVPHGRIVRWQIALGGVLGVVCVGLLASRLPVVEPWGEAALFWLIAAVTVVSATAMISMRSPVYCAIWFAMTLLGTSCLFLLQGAQLLAVATIVVYAGAIVVMFLFLIMLAQPEGHEYYDRISWSSPAALASSIAGAGIVLLMTTAIVGIGNRREALRDDIAALLPNVVGDDGEPIWTAQDIQSVRLNDSQFDQPQVTLQLKHSAQRPHVEALREALRTLPQLRNELEDSRPADIQIQLHFVGDHGTQAEAHVANLGGMLFSRYLIAVEVAGTLLLIALVGAVSIVIHGRQQERTPGNGRQESPPTESSAGGDA